MMTQERQGEGLCTDFTYRDLSQGNSLFTLVNTSGERYTYLIHWRDTTDGHGRPTGRVLEVLLLTGPNNTRDYRRIGVFLPETGVLDMPASSAVRPSAPSVRMLRQFIDTLHALDRVPTGWQVWLAGVCLRCGRQLTVPASISMKYGSDCMDYILGAL